MISGEVTLQTVKKDTQNSIIPGEVSRGKKISYNRKKDTRSHQRTNVKEEARNEKSRARNTDAETATLYYVPGTYRGGPVGR